MRNASAKNKIYVLATFGVGLAVVMHMYLFGILEEKNQALVTKHANQQHTLATLKAEVASYKQAQAEIEKVKKQKYQPGELFSKDVALVNELRTLEALGQQYGVTLVIGGVSGTIKNAAKAKTQSEVFLVPYSLSIEGPFENVIQLLQHLEHLEFITSINSLSVNAVTDSTIAVSLTASFYLRK